MRRKCPNYKEPIVLKTTVRNGSTVQEVSQVVPGKQAKRLFNMDRRMYLRIGKYC